MFMHKTTSEHGKYLMHIVKTGNIICCLVSKHDPETSYNIFRRIFTAFPAKLTTRGISKPK
jgi:hypothetical protein